MTIENVIQDVKNQVEAEIRSTLHSFGGDAPSSAHTPIFLDLGEWQELLSHLGTEVSLKRSDHDIDKPIS